MRKNCALVFGVFALFGLSRALTDPQDFRSLCRLREAAIAREAATGTSTPWWRWAFLSWQGCDSPQGYDVCGPRGSILGTSEEPGGWEYVYCRDSEQWTKEGANERGRVTNMHLTDRNVTGTIPYELCALSWIKELDLDGNQLRDTFPSWFVPCFNRLAELDLSFNYLYGPLPTTLSNLPFFYELELDHNLFSGEIPTDFCNIGHLLSLDLANNDLVGIVPQCLDNHRAMLTRFGVASNRNLSGNLDAMLRTNLVEVSVHNNPNLCGNVPNSVRWANGFNSYNTSLGRPCPGEVPSQRDLDRLNLTELVLSTPDVVSQAIYLDAYERTGNATRVPNQDLSVLLFNVDANAGNSTPPRPPTMTTPPPVQRTQAQTPAPRPASQPAARSTPVPPPPPPPATSTAPQPLFGNFFGLGNFFGRARPVINGFNG